MKPLDQNLLRPNQVAELERERDSLQHTLYGGVGPDGQLPGYRSPGGGETRAHLHRVEKMLHEQSPEPLTGVEKDKLSVIEKELRTDIIQGMLSGEEMRKAPPTAVDRHIRWERANKAKIARWKNVRLQLNAGTDERDIANLEQYRPSDSGHRIMTDALIPGLHAMSPTAKENWPLGEPTCDTAEKQTKRVHRVISPEAREKARQNIAKARATRMANLAAREAAASA